MIRKAAVIVLLLTAAFLPAAELPKSIVMESGDVRVRLDAKKRWNINRIEWKRQLVCIDSPEAHYGTTCRPAGSPHFIGSGHAESGAGEEVESVKIFSDGKEVVPGTGVITGKSVGMEKRSKIHDFRVKYTFEIEDGVLDERTEITAKKDVPLRQLYCFMHPWSTRFTDFHIPGGNGRSPDGKFRSDEKHPNTRFVPAVSWYDENSAIIVSTVVETPSFSRNLKRSIWDRRYYRKDYVCLVSDAVFPGGTTAVCRARTSFARQKDAAKWTRDADALCARLGKDFSPAPPPAAEGVSGKVDPARLLLRDGAKLENGVLKLDGKKAYAVIPGTGKYNVARAGLTLACAVKLDTTSRGNAEALDAFFSKEKTPFLFARCRKGMTAELRDETGKISAKTRADRTPRGGEWHHLAVTWEFYDDTVQGETAYLTSIYLDGEKAGGGKHPFFQPLQTGGDIVVGRGYGDPWFLAGEMADIFASPRCLTPGEIGALAASCKRVRTTQKKTDLAADGIEKISTPEADHFIRTKPGRGTPVAAVFDRKARRRVLDGELFSWEIRARRGKKKILVHSRDAAFTISDLSKKGFIARWQIRGEASFDVTSRHKFTQDGIDADLAVKNLSPDVLIDEVVFPSVKFQKLPGSDVLFFPYMCGAEIPNPTRHVLRYGQNYSYPSAAASMQYTAYYAGNRGVFLGWRDPQGTVKHLSASGRYDGIETAWVLPAAIPLDKLSGGNDFRSPGEISFKLFSGGWYEAAMLHRRWALDEADWGKVPAPRPDTPRWFREIACALSPNGLEEKSANEGVDQFLFLHDYLELPVYGLWFDWYDGRDRGWPFFPPRPFMPALFKKIMDSGCRIEPYTDGRLWDTSDPEWETRGKQYAVKSADGSICTERYGRRTYGVMCSSVPAWGEVLVDLSRRIAGLSSAVYHDQVTAAKGGLCFDKTHGHALNDPAAWIAGYRNIYRAIRKAVPDHPHVSEDMAEPYLGLFDGAHVWRWGFQGAVPAFQAIYGGRMQYFALVYDKIATGEPESNFSKMAYSLVNGIKIGRMEVQELFNADEKRLFFKKMSHLYRALVPYFDGGEMQPPLRFSAPVETRTLLWSGHWRRGEKVTTPVVASNSYKLGKTTVFLFVNPTAKMQSCRPLIPGGKLCLEGKKEPVDFAGEITLPPRSGAVVVQGNEAEARRLQETLCKIASFDAGVSYDTRVRFPERPPMRLARGELAGADRAAGFFAAGRYIRRVTGPDGKVKFGRYFGNTREKGLISWGTVDFGSETADKIYLHAAVSKDYAGSVVTVLTEDAQGKKIPLGRLAVPDTGGWMKFQKIPVKLDRPLKGKMPVLLRFERNGVCNLLGWEY